MTESLNFLPDEVRKGQAFAKRINFCLLLSLLLLGMSIIAAAVVTFQNVRMISKVAPLQERVDAMQDWEKRVALLSTELKRLKTKHTTLGMLFGGGGWPEALDDVSTATGHNTWLTACSISRQPDPEDPNGQKQITVMTLTGIAVTAADLINFNAALQKLQHIEHVELVTSTSANRAEIFGMVNFVLAATVQ